MRQLCDSQLVSSPPLLPTQRRSPLPRVRVCRRVSRTVGAVHVAAGAREAAKGLQRGLSGVREAHVRTGRTVTTVDESSRRTNGHL